MEPANSELEEPAIIELSQWSDDWCFIEITGPGELTELVVESVVRHEPVSEVLSCHYRSETGEYSYALFIEGKPMETFESKGSSIESVNFTSDLRQVPLQNMLRAADFMIESMKQFGIDSGSVPLTRVTKAMFYIKLPDKKTFWQALLGAASPR